MIRQQDNCTSPRQLSPFFSQRVNSFLNLLGHELVRSTTHLFGEYFLRKDVTFPSSSPSSPSTSTFPFLFFLIGICSTYPRLINSCTSFPEMYALSRHKCYSLFLFLSLDLCTDGRRLLLMTLLSTTSVTRLISWDQREILQQIMGYLPCLLKYVFLCPVCSYRWDYFQSSPPLKMMLWIQNLQMPSQVDTYLFFIIFNSLIHVFLKTPSMFHS